MSKKSRHLMKVGNIEEYNHHIFWITFQETEFSEKMWFMIILKVTKKQGFTLCQKNSFFRKKQRVGQIDHIINEKLHY